MSRCTLNLPSLSQGVLVWQLCGFGQKDQHTCQIAELRTFAWKGLLDMCFQSTMNHLKTAVACKQTNVWFLLSYSCNNRNIFRLKLHAHCSEVKSWQLFIKRVGYEMVNNQDAQRIIVLFSFIRSWTFFIFGTFFISAIALLRYISVRVANHANHHLKPDRFVICLARLTVVKIQLFFDIIFQFRNSRQFEN